MHRVTLDDDGKLVLPPALRRRYGLQAGEELLLEDTETGLALHPLRPDVRKVYLDITTPAATSTAAPACATSGTSRWGI